MTKSFDSSNFLISSVKTLGAFALVILLNACSFEASIKKPNPNTSSDAPLTLKIGDNTDNGSGNSITLLEVDEGSAVVFVVSQNKKRDANTELQISISGDLALISGAFSGSFPLSKNIPQGETSSTIVLSTVRDLKYSGPKTFDVVLSVPGTTVSTSFSLTLRDLDSAPVLAFSASSQNLSEGAGSGTATVTISPASSESVSVVYSFINNTALNGSHYTGTNSSLVFAPGETSKTISFNLTNDAVSNSTRDFSIALGAVTGTASVGSPSSHTVNLLDNESPTLSIANVSGAQGGNVVFTVTLAPTSFQTVTVNYATANNTAVAGAHFTTTSGTLSFNAGESSKTITVPATSVSEVCGVDRIFDLNLSSAVNATIGINSATGTITDPKLPSLSVADSSATEGSNLVFTASLSQACASKAVSFDWATANGTALSGTDYGAVSSSGSITAGNTSASLTVSSINNGSYQGSRTFSVTLSNLNNASSGTLTATGTINDDETPMGVFNITGITSTLDVLDDAYLSNATSPTVGWGASTNATSYDVTIYQNDGTTVQCATQNTASTSLDMGGTCTLTPGQTYKAKVTAKNGAQTQDAANALYSFYVNQSPVVGSGGEGPWYVMSGGAITINAQWAASPAVGVATDPEGHVLSFTAAGAASLGTVDTSAGTSLTYTAGVNNGRDTFTYTITDDKGGKLTGTITIHVMKNFAWTGKTSTTWATASNWCGTTIAADKRSCNNAAAAPGASDTIYFDDTCVSSFTCTPTTAANISVAGVNIKANGFTQGAGFTITVGSSGWTQSGGNFAGGNSNISIKFINITSGTFLSTSSTLTLLQSNNGTTVFSYTGGSFNHNNGTVAFDGGPSNFSTNTINIDIPNGLTLWNLSYRATAPSGYSPVMAWALGAGQTLTVANDFSQYRTNTAGKAKALNGTIQISGNISSANGADGGTSLLLLNGSGNQTYAYTGGMLPPIKINKTSGTVSPAGGTTNLTCNGLDLTLGDFTAPSGTLKIDQSASNFTVFNLTGGTYNHNSGTLAFDGNQSSVGTVSEYINVPNGLTVWNLSYQVSGGSGYTPYFTWTLGSGQRIDVLNDFSQYGNTSDGYSVAAEGTINVYGNIISGNRANGGSTTLNLTGTANQTYTSTGGRLPPLTINKSAGTVSAAAGTTNLTISALNLVSGSFTAPSNTLTIHQSTSGSTVFNISGGSFSHNNSTLLFSSSGQNDSSTRTLNINVPTGLTLWNLSLSFIDGSGYTPQFLWTLGAGQTINVLNNYAQFKTSGSGAGSVKVNNGSISIGGAINIGIGGVGDGSRGGTTLLTLNGSGAQTISQLNSSNTFPGSVFTINKSSGSVDLASAITFNTTGQDLTLTSGTINMNGYNLSITNGSGTDNSLTLGSGTVINKSGGTLSYESLTDLGGTINP